MPAFGITTTALAIDGWHVDRSAPSASYPSPSMRVECVLIYWCQLLEQARGEGWWESMAMPNDDVLWELACSIGFGQWIVGVYGPDREGLSVIEQFEDAHGYLAAAAGLPS